jgi:hypothetical protein
MLQTSTTDSEIYLFPNEELNLTASSALNHDDEAFYNSIKEDLNKLSTEPAKQTVDNILNYSKSL